MIVVILLKYLATFSSFSIWNKYFFLLKVFKQNFLSLSSSTWPFLKNLKHLLRWNFILNILEIQHINTLLETFFFYSLSARTWTSRALLKRCWNLVWIISITYWKSNITPSVAYSIYSRTWSFPLKLFPRLSIELVISMLK